MHVEFVRSGGFAGIRLTASLDTEQLPAEQASNLDKLIKDADFFNLPKQIMPNAPGPDRFEYRITITSDQKERSVVVNEAAAPDRLRPLLDYLTTLALVSKK